jgi:hypothetical protein
MKKIIIAALTLISISAFASEKTCKQAYTQYHERNEMLRELFKSGEISEERFETRVEDSLTILKVSTPVMCQNVSVQRQKVISAISLGEILGRD